MNDNNWWVFKNPIAPFEWKAYQTAYVGKSLISIKIVLLTNYPNMVL